MHDNDAVDDARTTLGRREFIRNTTGALLVPFALSLGGRGAQAAAVPGTGQIGAYIRIDTSNIVTVVLGSSEMGQGILTGLAQLVAEEMNLNWAQVRAEHAPASTLWPNPYGNPIFGAQLTGGSTSTRGWYGPLRLAAAIARDTLIAAAQAQYGGTWTLAAGGKLKSGTRTATFADVVQTAATLTPPASATLATTTRFIGKRMPRLDIPAKVDGSAVFGMDVIVPGMKFASVVHSPILGGTVKTMPATPPGTRLVNLGNAVGVVASDTWTAMRVARGLATAVAWNPPPNLDAVDTVAIAANAKVLVRSRTATVFVAETKGSPVIGTTARKIDATYELPFLAHATMEVMNCTASVTSTSVEIWAPTQGQQFIIPTAAAITGIAPDKISVHTTFMGGGLGRKFESDFVAQAVTISKAVGAPVKLTWSREQDFGNDKYRPYALIRVRASLGTQDGLANLIYRNVSGSINIQRGSIPGNNPEDTGAVAGAVNLPYRIGAKRIEFVPLLPCDLPWGTGARSAKATTPSPLKARSTSLPSSAVWTRWHSARRWSAVRAAIQGPLACWPPSKASATGPARRRRAAPAVWPCSAALAATSPLWPRCGRPWTARFRSAGCSAPLTVAWPSIPVRSRRRWRVASSTACPRPCGGR